MRRYSEHYLTVYRGGREQRKPRPFSDTEQDTITLLSMNTVAVLMDDLARNQHSPRHQRLVQEAIERKRKRNGPR
jgi:hypothetical protein